MKSKLLHMLWFSCLALPIPSLAVTVSLNSNPPSPQPLGTSITWTAALGSPTAGHVYDYQFSVGYSGQPMNVRQDFNLSKTYVWTPSALEGTFMVKVTVRDTTSHTTLPSVTKTYVLTPRTGLTGNGAVNPTAHPLVAFFSGPSCAAGTSMQVRWAVTGSTATYNTSATPCNPTATTNFYIAGMLPNTSYVMRWENVTTTKILSFGSWLPFNTGSIPGSIALPTFTVRKAAPAQSQLYPFILHGFLAIPRPYVPAATDLAGNVVWYYPSPVSFFGRLEYGGNMFIAQSANPDTHQQLIREIDLAGNTVLETNASIVNEQLAAMGKPPIRGFHHEVRRMLPSGNILAIAARDVASTTAQGGTAANPVDIIGDVIIVLDRNMKVLWSWDSFAHLDVNRTAILDEKCQTGNAGCPPFNPAFAQANDWLHSNSVQYTNDGNLILSLRHQDWVIKINYADGTGDGSVLWRLGNGGDFALLNPPANSCSTPGAFEWFSHQHDAELQFNGALIGGAQVLTLYDNGTTRQAFCDPNTHSKGVIFALNEPGRWVNYNQNADLGVYSAALGSGQLLFFSGYSHSSYDSGFIGGIPNGFAQTTELDSTGKIVFNLEASALTYRTFRLQNLYIPPVP